MKKLMINFILALLLSLSIVLSVVSITVLNDDYIKLIFSKKNIYSTIVDSLDKEYKINNKTKDYDTDQVIRDVNNYISNRYKKLDISNYDENKIYYEHIYFMQENEIKKYSYIIYALTIIFIIITGNIFLHTKKKHNLDYIFLFSSIIIIIFTGYVDIFVDFNSNILESVKYITNHILLGVGVVLLELVFLKYGNLFLHNKIKKVTK